jgi:hypothetical protein
MNESRYQVLDENQARKQYEQFMKDVYERADKLNAEVSSDILSAINHILISDVPSKENSVDTIKEEGLKLNKKIREYEALESKLSTMSYQELKTLAKEYSIKGYSNMRKDLLILELGKAIYKEKEGYKADFDKLNNSYKESTKSTFPGFRSYITKGINDTKYKLENETNSEKINYYSRLLDKYRQIDSELATYEKFTKEQRDQQRLIEYTESEISYIDDEIAHYEIRLENTTDSFEKIVLKNNIASLKASKGVHLENLAKYQGHITSLMQKSINYTSATACRDSLISKFNDLYSLLRERVLTDVVEIDDIEFKQEKENINTCKEIIEKSFEKAINKENKLNDLLKEYGLSNVKVENVEKKDETIQDREIKTDNVNETTAKEESKTEEVQTVDNSNKFFFKENTEEQALSNTENKVPQSNVDEKAKDSIVDENKKDDVNVSLIPQDPIVVAEKANNKDVEEPSIPEPTNDEYDEKIDIPDPRGQAMVDSIQNGKPIFQGGNYTVYAGDVDPKFIGREEVNGTFKEDLPDYIEEVRNNRPEHIDVQNGEGNLTLAEKAIKTINNAGDKLVVVSKQFLSKDNFALQKIKAATLAAKRKIAAFNRGFRNGVEEMAIESKISR